MNSSSLSSKRNTLWFLVIAFWLVYAFTPERVAGQSYVTSWGLGTSMSNAVALFGGGSQVLGLRPDGTVIGTDGISIPGLTNVASVAAGNSHALALRYDGTVVAWGDNSSGQTSVPLGLSNVVSIAAGGYHSLAARSDGTVISWGWNDYAQTNVPTGLSNVVALAGSYAASVALKSDGTVVAWGEPNMLNVPAGLSNVVGIATGQGHGLALKANGQVEAWGLYIVPGLDYVPATAPAGVSNIVSISASSWRSLALRDDGRLTSWGENPPGQANTPPELSNVVSIASAGIYNYYGVALVGVAPPLGQGGNLLLVRRPFGQLVQRITPIQTAIGETFRFLAVDDEGMVNYQWRRNATNLSGATNAALILSNIQPAHAGNYSVSADSPLSTGTSSSIVLEVLPLLAAIQPAHQIALAGTNVSFSTTLVGQGPFSYQWCFNGTNLAGATNAVLSLANIQPEQAGNYAVVVSNLYGGVVSGDAVLEVAPLAIIDQPRSQSVLCGAVVTFDVNASFQGPFSYQWKFNAVDIPGATTSSLVLANVQVSQSGEYSVTVTNALGSATSSNAVLHVSQVVAWGYERGFGQTNVPPGMTNIIAISAGGEQSLALRDDGTVVQWGQMGGPSGLSNVVSIASGSWHDVALKRDGTISAWGNTNYGQAIPPTGLTNVVSIAANYDLSIALKADGTVAAWGWNFYGQTNVPSSLAGSVAAVGCGATHCLAVRTNGTVVAWGRGDSGQTAVPAGLSNVVAVTGGWTFSLALKSDGTVVAWGQNPDYTPYAVPLGLSNVVAIAANGYQSMALLADGTVIPWGYNVFGAVFKTPDIANGNGVACGLWHYMSLVGSNAQSIMRSIDFSSAPACLIPLPITQASNVERQYQTTSGATIQLRAVGTGFASSCQWQWNGTNLTGAKSPSLILTNVQLNQAGDYSLLASNTFGEALSSTVHLAVIPLSITIHPQNRNTFLGGAVAFNVAAEIQGPFTYQWRFNQTNIIGATNSSLMLTNVQINQAGLYSVIVSNDLGSAVSSNALLSVSQIAAWGYNGYGQTNVPTNITNPIQVAAGLYHSLVLKTDGLVQAWGNNANGQTTVPVGLSNVVQLAVGQFHNLALRADGSVIAWGAGTNISFSPNFGQARVPTNLGGVVAIAGGGYHSLALKSDGTVIAWGAGTNIAAAPNYGQSKIPTGLSNAVAIAAGVYHSLALRRDGSVLAWGAGTNSATSSPNFGQSKVPVGLGDIAAIAAGGYHSMALKDDGRVVAWGYNAYGQTNVPGGLSNVVAIAAGLYHSVALTDTGVLFSWGAGTNSTGGLPNIGQALPPNALANVQTTGAGGYHTLAIVNDGSPSFFGRLFDRAIGAGESITLNAKAIGQAALHYQWQLNGVNINAATNTSLILTNIPLSSTGSYQCVASNAQGSVTNSPIALTVLRTTPRFESSPPGMQLTGAGFTVQVNELSGHGDVILYTSTNLVDWQALTTNPPVLGALQFTDSTATNLPLRFYRVEER